MTLFNWRHRFRRLLILSNNCTMHLDVCLCKGFPKIFTEIYSSDYFYRGNAFFHGPWSVHPTDVEHSPTRLFFKREVFRSATEDTNPMLSIQGRCGVLLHKDYCTSRPTEIPEQDIYICESKYIEAEKAIRKLAKTVKVPVSRYFYTQARSASEWSEFIFFILLS